MSEIPSTPDNRRVTLYISTTLRNRLTAAQKAGKHFNLSHIFQQALRKELDKRDKA